MEITSQDIEVALANANGITVAPDIAIRRTKDVYARELVNEFRISVKILDLKLHHCPPERRSSWAGNF
jgi:hypothetical protein